MDRGSWWATVLGIARVTHDWAYTHTHTPKLPYFPSYWAETTHCWKHTSEPGMRMKEGLELWTERIMEENLTLGRMAMFVEILKRLN